MARGLGRDFFSILDDNIFEEKKDSVTTLKISDIEPRADQPRKTFDNEGLQTLADSIATHGVLQPIIVRENPNFAGSYEIIAGERRWRASKMAGLSEIPVVLVDGNDLKVAQIAIIENVQRENLNPVEEALAYSALMERHSLTQEQIAKEVGKSRPAIANLLRLLDLPDEVLLMLKDEKITSGHARALLGLEDEEDMITLAQKIEEKGLSVRDTERLVKDVRFTQLFTYIYSKRNGTKAAGMEDNISHKEKSEWLNRLIKIQQEIVFEHLNSFVGKTVRALVEEKNDNIYTARMQNTFVVKFISDKDLMDEFVTLKITGK